MNHAIVVLVKRNNCVVKTLFVCLKRNNLCGENSVCCLVEEWFHFANIGGIIDDSLLEANRAIVIYFCNREWTHEF